MKLRRTLKELVHGGNTYISEKQKAQIRKSSETKVKDEPVYYKGIRKESVEEQLKRAGIDWEKDKPSARIAESQKNSDEADMRMAAVKKLKRKR